METKIRPVDRVREIQILYKLGEITEAQAREMCEEPLKELNANMEKISKEFGKRHKPITFANAMRIRRIV